MGSCHGFFLRIQFLNNWSCGLLNTNIISSAISSWSLLYHFFGNVESLSWLHSLNSFHEEQYSQRAKSFCLFFMVRGYYICALYFFQLRSSKNLNLFVHFCFLHLSSSALYGHCRIYHFLSLVTLFFFRFGSWRIVHLLSMILYQPVNFNKYSSSSILLIVHWFYFCCF